MANTADSVLIVEARFYEDIADEMLRGAIAALTTAGAKHAVVSVPGCLEIPAAIHFALKGDEVRRGGRPAYDGYVALGCVIRGETDHYDHVASGCMSGLSRLVSHLGAALGNGVLTCDTSEQAWQRAKVDNLNKGGFAARAAIAMIALKRSLMAPQ